MKRQITRIKSGKIVLKHLRLLQETQCFIKVKVVVYFCSNLRTQTQSKLEIVIFNL